MALLGQDFKCPWTVDTTCAQEQDSLLAGSRYNVVTELSQGESSVVLLATDKRTGGTVILKKVYNKAQMLASDELAAHAAMAETYHPNIVQLIDFWSSDEGITIVEEYVPGGDLIDLVMQTGMVGEKQALEYARQTLQGLVHMHAKGFCHGDIKGENCLLSKDRKTLKIIDFGHACKLDGSWAWRPAPGTYPYAAPELLVDKCCDHAKADVWAVGIVLYCLVMGGFPWELAHILDDDYATYVQAQGDRFADVPSSVAILLKAMLCPSPAQRPTAAAALQLLLKVCPAGENV